MMTTKLFSDIVHEWAEIFMRRSFRDFKRFMDDSGLSVTQVNAMMRLFYSGTCGVSDLGDHLGITNAAASQMVERLVQMRLVARKEDIVDRRVKQLTLTPEGRALIERGIDARKCWMESLTTALTPAQQEMIASALTVLTDAARNLEDN